jgi:hypothetical protein
MWEDEVKQDLEVMKIHHWEKNKVKLGINGNNH